MNAVTSITVLGVLLGLLAHPASGQECAPAQIEEWKSLCRQSLVDVANTVDYGDQIARAGIARAEEAVRPSIECVKGGGELLAALFKECNPTSPAVNPVACAETLVGVPDTIESCEMAADRISVAIDRFREAQAVYGAAEVAFSDQGGDDVVEKLRQCGDSTCFDLAGQISGYAARRKQTALENLDELKRQLDEIVGTKQELEQCQLLETNCEATGSEPAAPSIKWPEERRPEIVMP